jgi:hypothetical protein
MGREAGLKPARTALGMAAAGTATLPVLILAAYAYGGAPAAWSAGLGAAVAAVSALGGLALLGWAFPRSPRHFLGAVVGSFLGRMILFSAAVALLAGGTDLPAAPFVAGLFIDHALFQALEIRALHRGRTDSVSTGER